MHYFSDMKRRLQTTYNCCRCLTSGGDARNEVQVRSPQELSPPTPFHAALLDDSIDDDDIKLQAIAARSLSKSNSSDQSATATSELRPPVYVQNYWVSSNLK